MQYKRPINGMAPILSTLKNLGEFVLVVTKDSRTRYRLPWATAFVAFTTEKYSHYLWMYLDALSQKLVVLRSMILHLIPEQKEEINYTAGKMLNIIGQIKTANTPLKKRHVEMTLIAPQLVLGGAAYVVVYFCFPSMATR